MNRYKVKFTNGTEIKIKARTHNHAWCQGGQYGKVVKVEKLPSSLWLLIYPALFALGLFAIYQGF